MRRETCAEIARQLDLAAYINSVGTGEGGNLRANILADACEALIAAIYLDSGLEGARNLFVREWASALDGVAEPPRDAKSALQEWSQERGLGLPLYEVLSREGPDHAPYFHIQVRIGALAPGQGEGPSKRAAEQAAATDMLSREATT